MPGQARPGSWAANEIIRRRSDVIAPQVTGWPGGPRRIPCLSCPRLFTSASKANRMCPRCTDTASSGGDVGQMRGKRNGSLIRGD